MSKSELPVGRPMQSSALPVAVAVLAAGLSRRMGAQNKLLELIDGRPMVRQVVKQVLASQCNRVLVVLGHEAGRVQAALADLPVQFIVNHQFQEGLAASVRAAAARVRQDEALMVCLGDMPRVTTPVLDRLIGVYRDEPSRLAWQPVHAGQRGNPVLWSPTAISYLFDLEGDAGARYLLQEHREKVQMVSVDTDGILLDVDTPEALSLIQQEKVLRT